MKKKIRSIICKYPKILYIILVLKNINNKRFINSLLDLYNNKNPMNIKIESYGKKNKNKIIYFINKNNNYGGGFFCEHRTTLEALFYADRFGFTPVIKYGKNFPYTNDKEINGTINPFEYYFNPVSSVAEDEILESFNVVLGEVKDFQLARTMFNDEGTYEISDSYIDGLALISKKYIKLNNFVRPIINEGVNKMTKHTKTLGVHIRGTDFNIGFNDHPIPVPISEFIDNIKQAINTYGFNNIFLATDDNRIVKILKLEFGEKLIYYDDVIRSNIDLSVMLINEKRENNKYYLGLEVLRDMYTLANCDGLIAGLSWVSIFSRITKKSYDSEYEYINIINKGINISKMTYSSYYMKFIKKRKSFKE